MYSVRKKSKVQDIQDGHHLYLQQGDMHTDTHTHRKGGRRREEDNQSLSGKIHKKQVTVKQ